MRIFATEIMKIVSTLINNKVMRNIWAVVASVMLMACVSNTDDDGLNLTSKFNETWNIHESFDKNSDGSITYHAIPWSGLVASVREQNLPVDWSKYESISVEFSEPTKFGTQIAISDQIKVFGKAGITTLTCYFDGQDVSQVGDVVIQTAENGTVTIKRVYLTPGTSVWDSAPIWTGECDFGNWENGIIVPSEKFLDAQEGDKLEILYQTDTTDPDVQYWQLKTIYNGTEKTLEGNANNLNDWGCALVGHSGIMRIRLTANDIKELRKVGMFVNGYYTKIKQVNLLKRGVAGGQMM